MKGNSNLRKGKFPRKELEEYGLLKEEIELIMEYQKKLPILQHEDQEWVNARELHEQLRVKLDFSTWVKQQFDDLDAKVDVDFCSSLKRSKTVGSGGHNRIDYSITVDLAKDIAMTAGAKGGRTNQELKAMSKLVRKYFKIMESIAKKRINWNIDRKATIDMYKPLKRQLLIHGAALDEYLPDYWHYGGVLAYEMNMINLIVIGMSAKEYKRQNALKSYKPIRNTFNEETLEIIHKLEQYDTDLIEIEGIMDTDEREKKLRRYFEVRYADKLRMAS